MLTLHCRVLGSFPSDAAYALANYGHVNKPCWGFSFCFSFGLFFSRRHHVIVIVMRARMKKLKSYNLNHRLCIVHQEFKYEAKGLNTSYKFC